MMLQYVYEQHEDVARFVADLIPHARGRSLGKCKAIGVLDANGRPIAGIVYHNWNEIAGTIEITGAAVPKSNWLTRETIFRMFEYPFIQLKCQMVVQNTPADEERLLEQLARGGYMFVKYPRQFGRDRDGIVCLFTREAWEQCPFMRWKQRQPVKEAA